MASNYGRDTAGATPFTNGNIRRINGKIRHKQHLPFYQQILICLFISRL